VGTARAIHRTEITARAVHRIHIGGSRQQGLFAAETSTPATRVFNRFSLAPNPPGGFVASVKRHHTTLLSREDSASSLFSPLQVCWIASRKKRSAFTTFLREEYRSGATKRG
jgi:hypothetical protein